MEKLTAQLIRLYLLPGLEPAGPAEQRSAATPLVSPEGRMRAIVVDFPRAPGDASRHWEELCQVANTLQEKLGFPAPAVSISGDKSFRLWLSLREAVPVAVADRFLALLHDAWFPELRLQAARAVALPPCPHGETGKWAAFIHPGMGASFAGEEGLDMAPPAAAQLAFLEGLESIAPAQFQEALAAMQRPSEAEAAAVPVPAAAPSSGLLLKDATLEDIVRHLHALGIEPTFRHVLPGRDR
ncbi:hypothetical protein [Massilia sp.]|uniref:hypothetical protein n=1 Tax=Massilia sp. TaxID=1882437 RepID=UPI00391DB1AC